MEEFRNDVLRILGQKISASDNELEVPPDSALGDFAFPCFRLAKERKKSPALIASELAGALCKSDYINRIEANGPYINFFVNDAKLCEIVFSDVLKLKQDYGRNILGKGKKVMLEFPSPNTNKPLHLGHVRNMLIGSTLAKIYGMCGFDIIRANLMNDRGIHICKSMLAYNLFGNCAEPDIKPDHFVGRFYVKFAEESAKNPSLEESAYQMLRNWELGDKEVVALWRKMNNWTYKGFNETFDRLGISFDVTYYESSIYDKGKDIVLDAKSRKIFTSDDKGNVVAELKGALPDKVVLRADSTAVYITQDIYLAKLKFDQYPELEMSIYVVASEQNLHFQQLFAILKMLGYDFADKCFHMNYGMISLPEGRMKSREGKVVDADDLMDEMHNLALAEVRKRYPSISPREASSRAEAVGLSALKFFFLKYDAHKDFVFNPEESIAFEGDTGPYLQYTYARICSILRKHDKKVDRKCDVSLLSSAEEKLIIRKIAKFPKIIEESAINKKISLIPHYLLGLAQIFNEFYHKAPVLQSDDNLKKARLVLISAVKQVLRNGLHILNIECLEEM